MLIKCFSKERLAATVGDLSRRQNPPASSRPLSGSPYLDTNSQKYNQDSEGLQVVERQDYPEVVPQHSQLEVAYGPEDHSTLESRNPSDADAWPESNESKGMMGYAPDEKNEKEYTTTRKRVCGLRRLYFWLLIGLITVVILAAVLGGVLGAHASNSKASDSPLSNTDNSTDGSTDNNTAVPEPGVFAGMHAQNKTGLALSSSGPGLIHAYFMNEDNQIVEADYSNKTWLSADGGEPSAVRNVTSQAGKGSPIAAVAYKTEDDAQHRQIFFYDSEGLLSTTNATDDGAWGEVYNPLTDISSYPGAKGLAACVGTNKAGLNGMRVYMANAEGYMQEIGFNFDSSRSPEWHAWMAFQDGSDPEAGVACNIVGDTNHLYFRNTTTSLLHQWTWDYADDSSTEWMPGPRSTNTAVARGGSVAATTDGKSTDYLFFQSDADTVMHGLFTGGRLSDFSEEVPILDAATVGYHLAAVWAGEATMLNQIADSPEELTFSTVSRGGDARNGTVVNT